MKFNIIKLTLLKFLLKCGALFYFIGGIVHFFGLTLFPWYTAALYIPYHDTVIALTAFSLAIILFTVSKNPIKNIDVLNAVIVSGFLAVLFSIYIIFKIDFTGPAILKKAETIFEAVLLTLYLIALILCKPKIIEDK